MGEPDDIRHVQLARMLGLPAGTPSAEIEAAARAAPATIAAAIFAEATDSDDVTGVVSAREYLEMRLAFFRDLLGEVAPAIRGEFDRHLLAWER